MQENAVVIALEEREAVLYLAEDAPRAVGVDGTMQPRAAQYGGGAFFTYSSQFLWVWTLLSEMEIPAGEHVFSAAAVRSGLRIDRIYLTKGRELPPDDGHFSASKRTP